MTLISDLKARQAAKVREIGEALVTAGYDNLDDQATALGLSRSTTWTIIRGTHKSSGLSAAILNRMLSAPDLHSLVRRKILEYALEKSAGLYGTPEIANEESNRDLPVRQNPPCNYELPRCSHFVGGDGRPHGDLLPCRLMMAGRSTLERPWKR